METGKKLRKTHFCINCKNVIRCKGAVDPEACINYEPRREVKEIDNTTNDEND